MNNNIKKLIEYELRKIISEQETTNDIFGKYLWADPDNKPNRKEKKSIVTPEKNTKEENEFYDVFEKFVNNGYSKGIEEFIAKYLRPLKAAGKYSKYISPTNNKVYRGMYLSLADAEETLKIPKNEIANNGNGPIQLTDMILTTERSKVMSWSANIEIALEFSSADIDGVSIIFVTSPNYKNNDFYLNPENLINDFSFGGLYPDEKEIISYGPVNIKKAFILYNTTGVNLDKKEEEIFTNFVYETTPIVNNIISKIYDLFKDNFTQKSIFVYENYYAAELKITKTINKLLYDGLYKILSRYSDGYGSYEGHAVFIEFEDQIKYKIFFNKKLNFSKFKNLIFPNKKMSGLEKHKQNLLTFKKQVMES